MYSYFSVNKYIGRKYFLALRFCLVYLLFYNAGYMHFYTLYFYTCLLSVQNQLVLIVEFEEQPT